MCYYIIDSWRVNRTSVPFYLYEEVACCNLMWRLLRPEV